MSRLIQFAAKSVLIGLIAVGVASCEKAPEEEILGQWQNIRTNYLLDFYSGGSAKFHNAASGFVLPLKWSIADEAINFEFDSGVVGRGGFKLNGDSLEITNFSIHGNDFNGEYQRQNE